MALTLAEEFLLMAYDGNGSAMIDSQKMSAAVAGAAVELTMTGSLTLSGPRLAATGQTAADPRLGAMIDVAAGHKPKDAVSKIAGFSAWRSRSKDLREALLSDLVAAGAFQMSERKILGLFPTTAWKPLAQGPVFARIAPAVVQGAEPDDRTAALIALLYAVDLLPRWFPTYDRKAVRRRGKQIADSDWGAEAVRKAVQEVQAAVMIATMAAVTAATTASTS